MSATRFPHGISVFGADLLPGIGSDILCGNVYWVGANAGLSWVAGVDSPECGVKERPFASLDYAIGQCTANNGDTIYLLPGHTSTISAAGSVTCDVAGINIIGLGTGSLRPTFTWSATASTWLVTAANVLIKNIICKVSIDSVVIGFDISGAGCPWMRWIFRRRVRCRC